MQIIHADRRPDVSRKEAMLARRIRQRTRKPGFTPVRNSRINSRINATMGLLTLAYQKAHDEKGMAMPTAPQIEAEARRAVARTLPAIPIGVRVRGFENRSKYNQENTRGNR